ncbi:MAG: tape measure protein [Enterobacter roggenkampii]
MAIGIEIALDPSQAVRGADQVDKALDGIADSADNAQKRVNNLSGNGGKNDSGLGGLVTAGKAFLGLQVVQQMAQWGKAFIEVADNINLLQSRINLYTQSQAESNAVFAQLQVIANKAGVSIQDTASSFARFASAGKDMGVTNDQVLKLIGNLQTMARVSGAASQESAAAIYQLSQSFASGRLQGDEFRSVSEQLPVVLDTLAKKLGVTRGELRQMATDGKLNSDVLLLLAGDLSDLEAQAAKLPRTVEQASAALMNNLGVAADALNDKLGISQGLAKSIDGISQALDYWTKKLEGTSTQTDELSRQASIQNGILQRQQEVYDGLSDKTSMYGKYLLEQINKQKAAITETENQISTMQRLAGLAATLAADLKAAQQPVKAPKADVDAQKQIDNLKANVAYTEALAKGNYELAASSKLGANATKEQIAVYAALLKQQTDFRQGQKDAKKDASESAAALKREQKQLEQNQEANKKYIKTLQDKTTAGQFDVQRAKEQVAQAMLQGQSVEDLSASYLKSIQVQNQLTLQSKQAEAQSRLNADATDAQRQAVDSYVASLYKQEQAKQLANQVTQIQTDTTSELNPVLGQIEQTKEQEAQRLAVLEEARQLDLVNEQQYQDMKTQIQESGEQQRNRIMTQNAAMLLGATGDLFGGIADVLKQSQGEQSSIYKAMFATSKAFAIAQAGILMWQNVAEASKVGFPWNIPLIAGALAQGVSILGNLQSVAAVGFATGGYVSGAGTGTSDSIPARLSNGEYVMPAKQTRQYRNELAAMRAGSYNGSGGSQMNVEVANYGHDNVQVQQMDDDRVRLIIGEEVPRINASEFNNPYSQTRKSFNSNYNAERKV